MSKPKASPPPRRRPVLRRTHALLAFAAMILGFPLALIGLGALVGMIVEATWIGLGVAALALFLVPATLANALLPEDPEARRPGLVRDVFAGVWASLGLAVVALAGSLMGAPLRAEAARLEDRGLERAAWLGRWMAGSEASFSLPAIDELAVAEAPAPVVEAAELAKREAAPIEAEAAEPDDEEAEAEADPETDDAGSEDEDEDEDEPEAELAEGPAVYSPAELFAAYAPAVVAINVGHGGFRSGGTGFFIDEAGTLATNHHVIDGAEELRVKLWDGTQIERVELLTSDVEADLALLRVDLTRLPKAPAPTILGDSEAVEVGEPVSVIGNPLGLDHTLTNGIVSARRVLHGERYIQMSAPISPGNSGGPVFDRHGRVIGVSVGGMVGGQNLNLAVPVSQLQALIADDYPERRSFGASSW